MGFQRTLGMGTIFIILTICLLPIYGQYRINNTANTIENTAEENKNIDLNNVNKGTNKLEGIDSELLNQVGEAAKKIAIGGANVLSNISGEIKKGLQ